jgi:hypothetical protein
MVKEAGAILHAGPRLAISGSVASLRREISVCCRGTSMDIWRLYNDAEVPHYRPGRSSYFPHLPSITARSHVLPAQWEIGGETDGIHYNC